MNENEISKGDLVAYRDYRTSEVFWDDLGIILEVGESDYPKWKSFVVRFFLDKELVSISLDELHLVAKAQ